MTLTDAGIAYALKHQDSLTARIALAAHMGAAQDWPDSHRRTAIATINRAASA